MKCRRRGVEDYNEQKRKEGIVKDSKDSTAGIVEKPELLKDDMTVHVLQKGIGFKPSWDLEDENKAEDE